MNTLSFASTAPEDVRLRASAIFENEAVPHFAALKKLALHLVRNGAEAEDLVQETYVQALHSFDRYQPGTNCRAWLFKIMFHKRSQRIRDAARYRPLGEDAEDYPAPAALVLPREFMSAKLTSALGALPRKYREIIWLCEVEEFTYREISNRLGVPIGTVMSRLHRGRRLLRKSYEQSAGAPDQLSQ